MRKKTAAKRKTPATRSPEQSRARLIEAARKVFAARGYHGSTVKEIADEAKLNVCLISHYFDGKEGLYRAALAGFGEARLEALERSLVPPRTREEFRLRLEMFVADMLDFHLRNSELTTILLRDMIYESGLWGGQIQNTLFDFFTKLTDYFESAREAGFIRKEVEPMIAASILYFTFQGVIQADAIAERQLKLSIRSDEELRRDLIRQTLDTIWSGLGADR